VSQAIASKGRRETMADQKAAEAAQTLLKSFQETNQLITERMTTTQGSAKQFAQSFFTEGMQVLKANQAVAQNFVAAQERATEFAHRFFTEGMEVLKANHTVAEQLVAAQERTTEFAHRFFTGAMEVLKTHQTLAQSIATAHERNMRFFQSFFNEGMEALKSQVESARTLMQELGQKNQEQQEAFQQLAQQSMANYFDLLSDPLSAYQQSVEAAQTATRQVLDAVHKKSEQGS
jgi:hypothetical protein